MRDSTTTARDSLLIDIEQGTILNAPPEATVSERWVDSHPFVATTDTHVVVGPDAEQVARGYGGEDYILYEVVDREIGNVYLKRDAG